MMGPSVMIIRCHDWLAHASAWGLASAGIAEVAGGLDQTGGSDWRLNVHVCALQGAGCSQRAGCLWFMVLSVLRSVHATACVACKFIIPQGCSSSCPPTAENPLSGCLGCEGNISQRRFLLSVQAMCAKEKFQAFQPSHHDLNA